MEEESGADDHAGERFLVCVGGEFESYLRCDKGTSVASVADTVVGGEHYGMRGQQPVLAERIGAVVGELSGSVQRAPVVADYPRRNAGDTGAREGRARDTIEPNHTKDGKAGDERGVMRRGKKFNTLLEHEHLFAAVFECCVLERFMPEFLACLAH